jgi:integrase/recombinase XerD
VARKTEPEQGSEWKDLVDDYLDYHRARGHSLKTIKDAYGYPLQKVLLPFCEAAGIRRPPDLTDRHLNRLSSQLLSDTGNPFSSRGGRPLSKSSVHSYMRAINSFLGWVRAEGETVHAKAPLPRLGRKVLDVLSRDEIRKLEDAAATERDKLIVRLLADTGIRLGELLALRRSDFVERDRHTFLKVRGKGSQERLVPISPALARRLQRYGERGGRGAYGERLFIALRRRDGADYRPLTPSGVQQMLRLLAESVGIKKRVHPHLFRHSYATHMLRKGMNPLILQQILGHASLDMITNVYSHLNPTDAYEAQLRALLED